MSAPKTLFEKIWNRHLIQEQPDGTTLLHVGRHLVHDGSRAGFRGLAERGLPVRHPERTFGTPDHYVSTSSHDLAAIAEPNRREMVEALAENALKHGITLFGLGDRRQGIVHVIGPEQGITQPGLLMVCGDSHTATHGALGALAFGIGASEVAHVLATQTLWQRKPKSMRITVDGTLGPGVTPKDVILAIIARIGAAGGTGHVIEYAGSAIRGMSMEGRLTVCNMSIEAGAPRRAWLRPTRPPSPISKAGPSRRRAKMWDRARRVLAHPAHRPGRAVRQRGHARRRRHRADGHLGHQPGGRRRRSPAPSPTRRGRRRRAARRDGQGARLHGPRARHGDAADRGRSRVHRLLHQQPHRGPARRRRGRHGPQRAQVPAMVVPGSGLVKAQAEAEGLDRIFLDAGLRVARAGLLDVRRHERRPGRRPASAAPRPPTATSSAARAAARAPTC